MLMLWDATDLGKWDGIWVVEKQHCSQGSENRSEQEEVQT